eukprot:421120-Pleurochrysis_carterae.AAC.1
MPKAPWARIDGCWTLPRAEVCALALPWSAWDQAAAQMPVGTYTVSIAKLGQLMRVALAKLPLRGDGTRSARELGEYLTEVGTLRPALSEAELFVCRLDLADFDCVSRRP